MGPAASIMPVLTGLSTALSVFQGIKGLVGGDKPSATAPAAPSAPEPVAVPVAASGGVDSLASGIARRRRVEKLQSGSGAASTVLSSAGTGGSLGAG